MPNIHRAALFALFAAALAIQPLAVHADDLYQVEITVFARPGGGGDVGSASAAGLHYPDRLVTLQAVPADAAAVAPFQALPPQARNLNNETAALARRGFPILFHAAWRQPVTSVADTTGVMVDGGTAVGSHHELEGYVALSTATYLHLDVTLWFSQFGAPGSGDGPVLPLPAGVVDPDTAAAPVQKLFVINQQRRIRDGELHYFDSPRFGALVQVTSLKKQAAQ